MASLGRFAVVATAATLSLLGAAVGCGDDTADFAAGAGAASGVGGAGATTDSSSSTGIDNACADAVITPEKVPVTMYIMFDKSGSMLFDQKWAGATAALIAFFQDEDSAGLEIALRFFPDDEPVAGCNEVACSESACETPLVDAGFLTVEPGHSDPQQQALVEAVNGRSPGGETPMYPALAGAATWAVAHSDAANKRTVVVLVTDGEPNGCNESAPAIAALAGDAFAQAEVLTYAIGMAGASLSQLDQIAQAGGTDKAFVVGTGSSVNKDLVDALEKIRTEELPCSFDMPSSESAGQEVEPAEVNITYTSGDAEPVTIPQVLGPADCGADGGWYYDNPAAPTEITLCPATCDGIKNDPDAVVEVVLGCKTVVK
jgi:hypothetical protein